MILRLFKIVYKKSWLRNIFFWACAVLCACSAWADIIVQLNINRPINEISDKFVSFTLKPEDLYKALDGPNRKTLTRMASMLSNAHVKFVGDFDFAAKTDMIRLRNPTKIVWKGFNKWTKAVNWSMIISVPYKPNNWDAMQTLKILNTSQILGIDEAIWQFGNDFGSSRASDYVSELKTFNIMVESFKETTTNWQTMGADISAGSSPDETRRYVEMSKDLNVAYGWIQSDETSLSNSLTPPFVDQDPALKVLFKSNVPVWLSLPIKKITSTHLEDEVMNGINWAQTMGDAANAGFETIFRPLSLNDLGTLKYDFYVTALFKKIMGSRVYPARPLGLFGRINKLYTHCANVVSGGLAFMVVNKNEQPVQIAVRSLSKLQDSEVWQYTLSMTNGHIMLNNKKVSLNSTLIPEIRRKHTLSILQLKTPGLSTSFWVLPNVNLEHCHFTEMKTSVVSTTETNQKIKRYSATDRLLKELIKESAKSSFSSLANLMKRHRRSVDNNDRFKRFVLEGTKEEMKPLVANFAENIIGEMKFPLKRGIFSSDRRIAAMQWLSNILKEPLSLELPQLKRNTRQSDFYTGPFFMTRDGKKIDYRMNKIAEIPKPEKKTVKYQLNDEEFDEENFFKNVGVQFEPEYVQVPEGDVFLRNVASLNRDEMEEELQIDTKEVNKLKAKPKEIVSEMKPLRLLPTGFFEAFPTNPVKPIVPKLITGSASNTLLFADSFEKDYGKLNMDIFGKDFDLKEDLITSEILESETQNALNIDVDTNVDNEDDFIQAQIDITKSILNNKNKKERESSNKDRDELLDATETKLPQKLKLINSHLLNQNTYNFSEEDANEDTFEVEDNTKTNSDEHPWWDLSAKRAKRCLNTHYPTGSWRNNMIRRNADPITAADEISPLRLHQFEHKINEMVRNTSVKTKDSDNAEDNIGKKLVKTFRNQVANLVDIVSQHIKAWYNALAKQMNDLSAETSITESNQIL